MVKVITCVRAIDVWSELSKLYPSHARVRTVDTHIALVTTKKHHLSIVEYYNKMRSLANDILSTGTPLRDEELASYILAWPRLRLQLCVHNCDHAG
jgi:hypothetical protein